MWAPVTEKNWPSKLTVSSVSRRRINLSASSKTAARWPGGTSNRSRSAGWAGCSPNTGRTRPGARPASEASCLATRTGLRPGSTVIAGADLEPAGPGQREGQAGHRLDQRGVHHSRAATASPPRTARARSTVSANWAGTPAGPGEMPIRTFISPSHAAGPGAPGRQPRPAEAADASDAALARVAGRPKRRWNAVAAPRLTLSSPAGRSARLRIRAGSRGDGGPGRGDPGPGERRGDPGADRPPDPRDRPARAAGAARVRRRACASGQRRAGEPALQPARPAVAGGVRGGGGRVLRVAGSPGPGCWAAAGPCRRSPAACRSRPTWTR